MLTQESIEEKLRQFPIFEYAFLNTDEINFYPNVRIICESECPRYGKSWSCPPAVGTLEECKARCTKYKRGLIFSTISEVKDPLDLEEALATRPEHLAIVNEIRETIFADENPLILTAESCDICEICTYPNAPCRHPELMYPCIESQSIIVTEICENHNLTFYSGHNTVTWFCLILY